MTGVGLMIPARDPGASEAFVVVSQTIAGIGRYVKIKNKPQRQ